MRRRRCGYCKEIYITSVDTPRYCSAACKKRGMRDKRERWKENNPNYMKNYMRKYRKKKNSDVKTRSCTRCGIEKELTEKNFYMKSANRDSFDTWCKSCKKEYDSTRYKLNRDAILKNKKKYYQNNKEIIKKRQREYYKSKESSL